MAHADESLAVNQLAASDVLTRCQSAGIGTEDAKGIIATLTALCQPSSSDTTTVSAFSPSAFTLHPPSTTVPPAVATFLHDLVQAAIETATSASCASTLTGTGSDSDDFSDVGVWVGPLPGLKSGNAEDVGRAIVHALALDAWSSAEIKPREAALPVPWSSASPTASKRLLELMFRLEDAVMFSLSFPDSPTVPLFLVGKFEGGWAGLASVAVWT